MDQIRDPLTKTSLMPETFGLFWMTSELSRSNYGVHRGLRYWSQVALNPLSPIEEVHSI